MVLSDSVLLEHPEADRVSIPEWSYVDAKLSLAIALEQAQAAMLAPMLPLADRIAAATAQIAEHVSRLPAHLRVRDPPADPHCAHVHAQALVFAIGTDESLVKLFRPYFPAEPALSHATTVAHRLIASIRALTTFLTFSWIDSGQGALWTFGTRAFTGGMVMAYVLLSGGGESESEREREERASLDAAIGALRAVANARGSSEANTKALQVLTRLRTAIHAGRAEVAATDPYTGHAMPMPMPLLDGYGDWEDLFRDLLGSS
jgi:hypothetical protein